MKKNLLLCFFITSYISYSNIIQVGEELEYEVSFLNIKLGEIKISTLSDTTINNDRFHQTKISINSNPNIPFYSLRAIFSNIMLPTLDRGYFFESRYKDKNQDWGYQKIVFSQKENYYIVRNQKWYNKQIINDTTYIENQKVLDGSTLFFRARENSGQNFSEKLNVIMDLEIGSTHIKYYDRTEKIKIDAVKYPIKTFYLEGYNQWEALYGLGGKFEGWFSADDSRVPIKARMKVYLGNINIELKKWIRTDWTPPKF